MVASKEQLTGNEKCMAVAPWYCLIDYGEIRFSSAEGLRQNFKHGLVGSAKLKLGLASWWPVFVVLVVLCCLLLWLVLFVPDTSSIRLRAAAHCTVGVFRQTWPSANHQSPQHSLWRLTMADPDANVFMFWTT
jgi:hypothetical protein